MKTNGSQPRWNKRRGTIYLLVLFSCLIVATISLSSLQIMRLQGRSVANNTDFTEARNHARAALEIGMLRIRNDPFWRTNFGNGVWLTNQTIGTGTFTLSATDPIDNDVENGDNHPVILTGTGMKGAAAFRTSVRLEVGPQVGSCLELSMISGDDSVAINSTLTSDQVVGSNGNYFMWGGAAVNANVAAFGSTGGWGYMKAVVQTTVKRIMPSPLSVLDYYTTNGTVIPYTALPTWSQVEFISNPSFETGVYSWYAQTNCVLQQSNAQKLDGNFSMLVNNRSSISDGAAQDLPPGIFKSGNRYRLNVPILPSADGMVTAVLTLTSAGSGTQTYMTAPLTAFRNGSGYYSWLSNIREFTPTWSGTLTRATLSFYISNSSDYYIDKVSLTDTTYASNLRVIDRQLLSPTVNPFGTPNTQGIYVLNCAGQDVVMSRSRIVGTIVFLNPGSNSAIQDSVCWEAAVYNFPAVLSNATLNIKMSSTGLSESSLGVNLNPAGTPFPFSGGASNATATESYPSKITGIIYSAADINFSASASVTGVVIAADDIFINATSLTLNYGNVYLNDPPPGFNSGTISLKVVPGTWKRSVN